MCEYLSVVIIGSGRILVSWDQSHETIIKAHGLDDTGKRARKAFLRAECTDGKRISYDDEMPEWYDKKWEKFEAKIRALFVSLKPIYDEYWAKRKPIYDENWAKRKTIGDEYTEKMQVVADGRRS